MNNRKTFSVRKRNQLLKDADTGTPIQCACGQSARHIHHIVPVSEGGTDESSNLKMLCQKCHVKLHSSAGDFAKWGQQGGLVTAAKQTSFRNLRQFRGRPDFLAAYINGELRP